MLAILNSSYYCNELITFAYKSLMIILKLYIQKMLEIETK